MKETIKRMTTVVIGTAVLCAVFFALAASLVLGIQPSAKTNQFDWGRGWVQLFAIFGGAGSFFALGALLVFGGLAVWLLTRGHLTYYERKGKNWRLWLNLAATVAAGLLAAIFLYNGVLKTNGWIHITGTGWMVLGGLAFIGALLVASLTGWWALNAHLTKKRITEPSPTEDANAGA